MLELLKSEIQQVFGHKIVYAKDCIALADTIKAKTGRSIGGTTLRRLFGLVHAVNKPSVYILDTLAIYIGYSDFNLFTNANAIKTDFKAFTTNAIADYTNGTLKVNNTHSNRLQVHLLRKNSIRRFNKFLNNPNRKILILAGEKQIGKTTLLNQWVTELKETENKVLYLNADTFIKIDFDTSCLSERLGLLIIDNFPNETSQISNLLIKIFTLIKNVNKITLCLNLKQLDELSKPYNNVLIKDYELQEHIIEYKLPILSKTEVKQILRLNNFPEFYLKFSWQLFDFLRIPGHINNFGKLLFSSQSLPLNIFEAHQSYLNEYLYNKPFLEEKLDILSLFFNKKEQALKKNYIKDKYPIHLKKAGNYWDAYKNLVQDNLLIEEQIENKFGLPVYYVKFKSDDIYFHLMALNLVEQSESVSFETFKNTVSQDVEIEYKVQLICNLYQMAYYADSYDTIKDFFSLPNDIICNQKVINTIGECLREEVSCKAKLIEYYAQNPKAQEQLFERYVDINHLTNTYQNQIIAYLKYKHTENAKLFGYSVLYLAAFYNLNAKSGTKLFLEIEKIKPVNSHPWLISRQTSVILFEKLFVQNAPIPDLMNYLIDKRNLAYQNTHEARWLGFEFVFEIAVMIPLIISKKYHEVVELTKLAIADFDRKNSINTDAYEFHKLLLTIYNQYALSKIKNTVSNYTLNKWKAFLDNPVAGTDDFQHQLMVASFLKEWFMQLGNKKQADYFNSEGVNLLRVTDYKFFEKYFTY